MFFPVINLPNSLTLLRIFLTPFLVAVLLYGKNRLAFWTFVVGGISDAMDGAIARLLNQKTMMGTILDPVADKIFLSATVTVMSVVGIVPAWVAIALVSRDLIVILGVFLLKWVETPIPIRPHLWGKVTTLIEILYLFLVLMGNAGYGTPGHLEAIAVMTVILAILSGVFYVYQGIRWFQTHTK
ncbi:MAG: CDP-alcohol phosphatidyltransferase family protein [Nitrospirae bacterium]|nr:CDP-alcohol phosphatidyltransferase family protein [Nitrospirota bacterium]